MAISSNVAPAAAPTKQTLASAYIDFTGAGNDWAQQYLPDLVEQEAEIFGNRTISGFLSQVGAEEAMQSDQVVWSEQGRLHLSYGATMANATTFNVTTDADGQSTGDYKGQSGSSSKDHGIRVGDMLVIASASSTQTAYVTTVNDTSGLVTVKAYDNVALPGSGVAVKVLVFGSEFKKGTSGMTNAVQPQFASLTNKPIIIKDKYEVSGSDASQIGWVEVAGEEGQSGYLWYLKAAGDTKSRFADYLEMACIEAEKVTNSGGIADGNTNAITGTEGLFSALEARGNESTGISGVNAATDLAEFDSMLAEFDKNGAIEENMMFINRGTALAIDDMLASMNSYGAGGTSYGVFDNDEDMALNLGFSGFRRGSYDFYKSDWKYLNDRSTRGLINDIDAVNAIRGVVVPAGVSSVYDQNLGKNLKRPFLHVRYRASQTDDRKFKTWTTGSVGAVTSDLDAMEMHFLSERCLIVQGANNFMLLK